MKEFIILMSWTFALTLPFTVVITDHRHWCWIAQLAIFIPLNCLFSSSLKMKSLSIHPKTEAYIYTILFFLQLLLLPLHKLNLNSNVSLWETMRLKLATLAFVLFHFIFLLLIYPTSSAHKLIFFLSAMLLLCLSKKMRLNS
jgi:hypothetical protein